MILKSMAYDIEKNKAKQLNLAVWSSLFNTIGSYPFLFFIKFYSTVTDFARFLGLSTSNPLFLAI